MPETAPSPPTSKAGAPEGGILRLLALATVVALDFFVIPFRKYWFPYADGYDGLGQYIGGDFANFWTGAKLAATGDVPHVYDLDAFADRVRGFLGDKSAEHIFSWPPFLLLLLLPLGLLPYLPAFALWCAAGCAGFAAALRANPFCRLDRKILAAAVLCPAALFNLLIGQNGAFTGALFLAGLYLSEGAPFLAGALFGLLALKPHLGLMIPLALLLRRNWRCIGAAAATVALLAGASLLLWGPEPWHDYFTFTSRRLLHVLFMRGRILSLIMPGPWYDVQLFVPAARAVAPALFAAACALYAAVALVLREGLSARGVLALALATLLIVPYGMNYDMTAVSGALAVYLCAAAARGERQTWYDELLFGALWALPLAMIELKLHSLPVSSPIMLLVLARLELRSRSEKRAGG